jgi:hypothetical protein
MQEYMLATLPLHARLPRLGPLGLGLHLDDAIDKSY